MKLHKTLLSLAVGMAFAASVNAQTINSVLLISVDGLHQNDLDWYVKNYPSSTLAGLVRNGIEYNNASTPFPSDSFPGMVAQATGGNPRTTGIYYDDEYSRTLLPLGTSQANCQAGIVPLGAEVYYAEVIEPVSASGQILLDASQGIPGLYPVPDFTPGDLANVPTNILKLAGSPNDLRTIEIDPSTLPVDPYTCTPVYPHQYLKVNTIFEVARSHGLRTAWTDKHPAYEILNGPSGYGVDDLFAPEINSVINLTDPNAPDWTTNNVNTQKYDTFKVLSIINEINGYDHSGVNNPGTPAIFGMNFQSVSTAQKLSSSPTPQNSASQLGGYNADGTPGPVLISALHFVDASLGQMQAAIDNNTKTQASTAIIVSAKHGQSPELRSNLTLIDDTALNNAVNAAWAAKSPKGTLPLIAHSMDDDGVLFWLNDRSKIATDFAKNFLLNYTGTGIGSDAKGNPVAKPFTNAGLEPTQIYSGTDAAKFMGVGSADVRVPDLIGIAKPGSVYAGTKLSKIAEHGGGNLNDRHVPIIVSGPGIKGGQLVNSAVGTTQIAPTILQLLGIAPTELHAVTIENTAVLPNL